jgi:sec-independent protein translocase protein TatA
MSLGTPELVVIFVLILLLFGPNRLPELARGLGKGMREFRKVTSEFQSQLSALGEHDDEPRRAQNEASISDYRTASYDSNKLDNTSSYDDHESDYNSVSRKDAHADSPPTDNITSEQDAATSDSNGAPPHAAPAAYDDARHESSALGGSSATGETKTPS